MRYNRSLLGAVPAGRLRLLSSRPPFLLPWTCRRCFSEEIRRLRQSQPPPEAPKQGGAVIFSGIQPTGVPHLGNYLGALQQWVRLQNTAGVGDNATELYYSVVDLHALTTTAATGGGDTLRQRRREMLAALLAIGLDPERCVLFYQSSVAAHSELMWLLSCTASVGYLSRMTQWKASSHSKLQLKDNVSFADEKARVGLKLGLFSYPVLQAADVLVHRATHVPVGEDQAQHLEFARECATNFNHAHGPLLVAPTTLLSPARRVMSLQQPALKMSKSHSDPRSRILLTDSAETVKAKLMAALTDSTNAVSYDPVGRPGVANLLELLALVGEGDEAPADSQQEVSALAAAIASELDGKPLRVLKERTADAVVRRLAGIRERFVDALERDAGAYLDRVAAHGAKKAQANAQETMEAVRAAVGL